MAPENLFNSSSAPALVRTMTKNRYGTINTITHMSTCIVLSEVIPHSAIARRHGRRRLRYDADQPPLDGSVPGLFLN